MTGKLRSAIPTLTSLADIGDDSLQHLLARADALDRLLSSNGALPASLSGITVANLFFEPSTRTRASFELAATRLGAHVINLDMARSSTVKGESVLDTIRTLHAMNVQLFVVRHAGERMLQLVADALVGQYLGIVSAGEGRADHPTQGLIDALTLLQRFGNLEGRTIAIVGDIVHSRVARSAIHVMGRLGANLRIAGPAGFMPPAEDLQEAVRCASLDEAMDGADVVMALRIQRERMTEEGTLDEMGYFTEWGLTENRLAHIAPDALVMHPGPFNREVEIASEVADGPRSLILRQVALGIPVRMAVLEWLAQELDA